MSTKGQPHSHFDNNSSSSAEARPDTIILKNGRGVGQPTQAADGPTGQAAALPGSGLGCPTLGLWYPVPITAESGEYLSSPHAKKWQVYSNATYLLTSANNSILRKIGDRQSYCRIPVYDEVFTGESKDGKLGHIGLSFCHNRHSCGYCSSHYLTQQRKMTVEAFELWTKKDSGKNDVLVMTLTIPHAANRKMTKKLLKKAWSYFSKYLLPELRSMTGFVAFVKRFEATFGRAGDRAYHPHFHFGLFVDEMYRDYYAAKEGMTPKEKEQLAGEKMLFELNLSTQVTKLWDKAVKSSLQSLQNIVVKNPRKGTKVKVYNKKWAEKDYILETSTIDPDWVRRKISGWIYQGGGQLGSIGCYWGKDTETVSNGDYSQVEIYKSGHKMNLNNGKWDGSYSQAIGCNLYGPYEMGSSIVKMPFIENIETKTIKGGASIEMPRDCEAWAEYLSTELNYGSHKEAKKEGKDGSKYCWQELLMVDEDWARKAFRDYVLDHRGERQFEFSRSKWPECDRRMSFYTWLTKGKTVEEQEQKSENELIITHSTPAQAWAEAKRDRDDMILIAEVKDIVQRSIAEEKETKKERKTLENLLPSIFTKESRSQEEIKSNIFMYEERNKKAVAQSLVFRNHIDSDFVLKYYFDGDSEKRKEYRANLLRENLGLPPVSKGYDKKVNKESIDKVISGIKPNKAMVYRVFMEVCVSLLFVDIISVKKIVSKIWPLNL